MENRTGFKETVRKLYGLLDKKQKKNFAGILVIMAVSACLLYTSDAADDLIV